MQYLTLLSRLSPKVKRLTLAGYATSDILIKGVAKN
jgi:hypothetical protein